MRARCLGMLKGEFVRHIVTLVTGAALAQMLPLLVQPVLTRLYTPHDFGVFTVYSTWMSNLAVLATARYEMAIVLPADERRAINLMGLALLFSTVLALAVMVFGLFGGNALAVHSLLRPDQGRQLVLLLPLLPLSLWFAGLTQAWTNWNNRQLRYRANANGRMGQAVGMSLVQLGGGLLAAGPCGLILGQLAGQAGSLLAQAWIDIKQRFPWRHQMDRSTMRSVAAEYVEFPKVNTPHAFVGALQDSVTMWLLVTLASTSTVGFYGRMMLLVKLPAALIGQAVSQVAYRELAQARNAGAPLRPILRRLMLVLGGLALLPFIIIRFAGEPLFALVLGKTWGTAGLYAEAIAPFILLHFVASPLSTLPLVVKKQRQAFLISLVQMVLFIGALWAGFKLWGDPVQAFSLLAWVMVGYFLLYFAWLYRIAK
ncbi:lipopolysaccharide biosynthesis protein [Paludibacterium yongneupense]|nr:lipopolysaccharide biosynthesis protein [Paludibacterium yongneupense]